MDKQNEITVTKEMVAQFKQTRAQDFLKKFTALCNEMGCDIVARPLLSDDGRVVVDLQVKVRD